MNCAACSMHETAKKMTENDSISIVLASVTLSSYRNCYTSCHLFNIKLQMFIISIKYQ